MECEDGSVYIGQTEDLRQRWQQHYSGKGGRWTKGHPPIRVVHWEMLPSREKSVEREKWLKTGYGRKWLKEQIAATSARTQTGDPVHAKVEGRDPGLPKHIADVFPDRFEESELGEIPEGWAVGSILNQAKLLSGGTPKTENCDYWDGEILWASAKDVSQCGQTFLVKTERTITQKGLQESATQLIPAFCAVVIARDATTGRMVMVGRKMAMNQTCYALASTTDRHSPSTVTCGTRWTTWCTRRTVRFLIQSPRIRSLIQRLFSRQCRC
ncbi:MAG: GIY-YIG nuclease family protein [Candidatus Binatia bacterium]